MSKKSVLIIDDELENRKLLKIILKKAEIDIDIYEADSGLKAIEILQKSHINLILLDLLLPDMNGIHILKYIKEDIPTIIITALEKEEIEIPENFIYIQKPVDIQKLIKILKEKLENNEKP